MSEEAQPLPSCPLPPTRLERIRLGHGSGGKLTAELIEGVFLPRLGSSILAELEDAALLETRGGRLAMTTDSYVVNPIFFPGGDIGSLAVHGTVNDLAMRAARPLFLAVSFILEEGLPIADLERVAASIESACRLCAVDLVAADTKVVNRGAADRMFLTTTGIGLVESSCPPGASRARPGDVVIVSGPVGMHGMAIMCAREGLELATDLASDSAPLHDLVAAMLAAGGDIHCLRDLTRGGLSSALNELAVSSSVGIEIDEAAVPVHPEVRAACEILGLDPLYVACEGRLVAVLPEDKAEAVLASMRCFPQAAGAALAGRVVSEHAGRVVMKTLIGGRRIVDKLSGEQLPRIC